MKHLLILLLAFSLQGCCALFNVGCAPVTHYQISGTVKIIQECVPVTPNQITINLTLVNGVQEVGKTVTVPLVNGVGQYFTSVPWSGGAPIEWKRITSNDVCGGLICNTGTCTDTATDTPTFPANIPTVKDVRFVCACQ